MVNDGSYSLDWLAKTFGKVYYDWMFYQSVSEDASKIVEKFIEKERGITITFYTGEIDITDELPKPEPIDLDGITEYSEGPHNQPSNDKYLKFREQWISEDDLSDEYNITRNGKTIDFDRDSISINQIVFDRKALEVAYNQKVLKR